MFVEMEQVFQVNFPSSTIKTDLTTAWYNNNVIQDCFCTYIYNIENTSDTEDLLTNILYM